MLKLERLLLSCTTIYSVILSRERSVFLKNEFWTGPRARRAGMPRAWFVHAACSLNGSASQKTMRRRGTSYYYQCMNWHVFLLLVNLSYSGFRVAFYRGSILIWEYNLLNYATEANRDALNLFHFQSSLNLSYLHLMACSCCPLSDTR